MSDFPAEAALTLRKKRGFSVCSVAGSRSRDDQSNPHFQWRIALERFAFENGNREAAAQRRPARTKRRDRVSSAKRHAVWCGTRALLHPCPLRRAVCRRGGPGRHPFILRLFPPSAKPRPATSRRYRSLSVLRRTPFRAWCTCPRDPPAHRNQESSHAHSL